MYTIGVLSVISSVVVVEDLMNFFSFVGTQLTQPEAATQYSSTNDHVLLIARSMALLKYIFDLHFLRLNIRL